MDDLINGTPREHPVSDGSRTPPWLRRSNAWRHAAVP